MRSWSRPAATPKCGPFLLKINERRMSGRCQVNNVALHQDGFSKTFLIIRFAHITANCATNMPTLTPLTYWKYAAGGDGLLWDLQMKPVRLAGTGRTLFMIHQSMPLLDYWKRQVQLVDCPTLIG